MTSTYLFAYGLLRKGANHEMSDYLNDHTQFISRAFFQGKLYLIDYYPGIIPSANSDDKVIGDVYALNDLSILEEVDHFEGVGDEFEKPNEYRREIQQVIPENGNLMNVWIYLYNGSVESKNQIKGGDFLSVQH